MVSHRAHPMKQSEVIVYSLKSLRHRQMRSWLTVLGIVIGIAAVVSLLTIGEGFNKEVEKQLGKLGGNTVFITPLSEANSASAGFSGGQMTPSAGKLYQKDVDRLRRIADIEEIARLAMGRATILFKEKEIAATVQGIEPGVFEKTTDIGMAEGRFLLENDRHAAVIGDTIAYHTFGDNKNVGVGSYLEINGQKYRVVGIIQKTGGGFGPAARLDTGILVHFEDARLMFNEQIADNEVGAMAVLLREGSNVEEAVESMKMELDASHKVKAEERDYSIVSPATIQAAIGTVLSLITVFLGAVAGISLIVGALAIASGMFTSVIERTHEIGVLKSVGAKEEDILGIFLFESGAIGAIGGLIGTAVGLGVVFIGSLFGLPLYLNPAIALFGILFAFGIGLASGYIPARQAAKLSPVDALRYE